MLAIHKHYYTLLGLPETASIQDIKHSYREKAKLLHPDNNSRSDANEQFSALSEAYRYLIELKTTGFVLPRRRNSTKFTKEDLIKSLFKFIL